MWQQKNSVFSFGVDSGFPLNSKLLKTTQTFSDSTQMSNTLPKIGGVNLWAAIVVVVLANHFQTLIRFIRAQREKPTAINFRGILTLGAF